MIIRLAPPLSRVITVQKNNARSAHHRARLVNGGSKNLAFKKMANRLKNSAKKIFEKFGDRHFAKAAYLLEQLPSPSNPYP